MLNATRTLIKNNPYYLAVYVAVLLILLLSSYLEYQTRFRDLVNMIQDQAAMTAAVIARSSTTQERLTEELEQAYLEHALDVLELLEQASTEFNIDNEKLRKMIPENSLIQMDLFDEKGRIVNGGASARKQTIPEQNADIAAFLESHQSYLVEGFESPNSARDSLADIRVAVKRAGGGALRATLGPPSGEGLTQLIQSEQALNELVQVRGMEYLSVTLDDSAPQVASKYGIRPDSSWTRKALDDILYLVKKDDKILLEIVRPIFLESGLGEVRIGFDGAGLLQLRGQIIYEVAIRSLLLTLLALVLLMMLITRQNSRYLEAEKVRIEGEVYRLERLNRIREKQVAMGELAAGVAHEIRNPLNAIGIIAQRLKREFSPGEDVSEYKSLTVSMSEEINRINGTLKDFLDYTRPVPLELKPVNAKDFAGHLESLYVSQAQDLDLSLKMTAQAFDFVADSNLLKQALGNLIKNALEASASGEEVQVDLSSTQDTVTIVVKDQGCGIPQEELNRIFDLYYSTKEMGTGVGLAITHKIIADHGGSIEVESEADQGSQFTITLPKENP